MPPAKARAREWDQPDYGYPEDDYNAGTLNQGESKREKRRRDMVERVERLRRDNIERREANFHEHITSLHESHLSLLSQPDPTHPLYLLRLHELSTRRDGLLLAAQVQGRRNQDIARRLYDEEKERTETEFEELRSSIKQRLIEACDERARKLREEKDSADLNLESFFEPPVSRHPSRARRPPANFAGSDNGRVPLPSDAASGGSGIEPYAFSLLPSSPLLGSLPMFSGAGASNSPLLAAALANIQAAAQTSTGTRGGYRKRGAAAGPGMPLVNSGAMAIAPGKYEQAKRCYAALTTLNGTEVTEDLDYVRRKRKRAAGMGNRYRETDLV